MNTIIGMIAFILYMLSAIRLGMAVLAGVDDFRLQAKPQIFAMGVFALFLNAILLNREIFVSDGLSLGFANVWALVSWVIVLVISVVAIRKPVEKLLIIFFPIAALGLLFLLFFPEHHVLAETAPMGLKLHILLSIIAYSLLTIAAFQAALLAFQEYLLSHRRPIVIMKILPPMQGMEDLLIRIIVVGFFILSLSLVTGFMFIHDFSVQHLIHKTVLSILSWLVFALLLWGRWYIGWRGQKLVRWTLGGFLILMLAFFGSKFVSELILFRA